MARSATVAARLVGSGSRGRWLCPPGALATRLHRSAAAAGPADPVPSKVVAVCQALCGDRPLPRLLQSPRLRVPLDCGLLRPTILLPASLCSRPNGSATALGVGSRADASGATRHLELFAVQPWRSRLLCCAVVLVAAPPNPPLSGVRRRCRCRRRSARSGLCAILAESDGCAGRSCRCLGGYRTKV